MKEVIKATPNYSKRTFTLRIKYSDGTSWKYRTTPTSMEEFFSCEFNTNNDWKQFLRNCNDYYVV